jgi:peptidoglycan/LPS O-acetylase OafA/YrhL
MNKRQEEQKKPQSEMHRLNTLTFARFLAAMGVVIYHAGHSALTKISNGVAGVFSYGYIYVGFFYVLSGFVLTYSLGQKQMDCRKFFRARVSRIYPAYLLALAAMTPPFLIRIRNGEYPPLRLVASVIAVPTMTQAWLPITAQSWNYPAWSVSAEFFFYLLFPFVVGQLRSSKFAAIGTKFRLMITLWSLSILPSLIYVWLQPDLGLSPQEAELHWKNLLYFSPILRLPEFLVGVVVGQMFLQNTITGDKSTSKAAYAMTAAGGLCIAAFLSMTPGSIPEAILHNGLLMPAWATLIYGLASLETSRRIPVPYALILLGESSYSIYILQAPVSNLLKGAIRAITGVYVKGDYTSPSLLATYCALLVLAGVLSFRHLETPARLYLRRLSGQPAPKYPGQTKAKTVVDTIPEASN